ncbi:MAG: hypothetical protein ISS63_09160 [Desulfobacteraceae bacterium]|nr:hypothetical protein [Desulfobacteraceae bacterium]
MKKGGFIGLCCSLFVFCLMVMAFGALDEVKGSPSVVFPEPGFEFDTVFEGIDVVHDFVIQNKGTAALDVQKVSGG